MLDLTVQCPVTLLLHKKHSAYNHTIFSDFTRFMLIYLLLPIAYSRVTYLVVSVFPKCVVGEVLSVHDMFCFLLTVDSKTITGQCLLSFTTLRVLFRSLKMLLYYLGVLGEWSSALWMLSRPSIYDPHFNFFTVCL